MDEHGLPTSFGGQAMAMSAEYTVTEGAEEEEEEEDAGFKVGNPQVVRSCSSEAE